MESRSLKVWPVAWINRLSSRVTRPHPRLRSFEYSRFLHPFSSRGYAGILQNSNPPFLFLGEEEKRKREFLSAKFILSLRKSSKGFERKIGWSGGKERKARRTPRRRQWAIDMSTFWRAEGARARWRYAKLVTVYRQRDRRDSGESWIALASLVTGHFG